MVRPKIIISRTVWKTIEQKGSFFGAGHEDSGGKLGMRLKLKLVDFFAKIL